MDKTTIVGQDGLAKYELSPENEVINLQENCKCNTEDREESLSGKVCKTCGCYLKKES